MQDGGSLERPALSLGSVDAHLYEIIQVCTTISLFSPQLHGVTYRRAERTTGDGHGSGMAKIPEPVCAFGVLRSSTVSSLPWRFAFSQNGGWCPGREVCQQEPLYPANAIVCVDFCHSQQGFSSTEPSLDLYFNLVKVICMNIVF